MPLVHRCPHCNGRDVRSALWVDPNATADDVAALLNRCQALTQDVLDDSDNMQVDVMKVGTLADFYCRSCDKRLASLVGCEEQDTFSVSVQVSYDIVVDIQADSMEEAKARARTLRIAHPRNRNEAVWPYPDGAQSFVVAAFEGDAGKLSEPQTIEYKSLFCVPRRCSSRPTSKEGE